MGLTQHKSLLLNGWVQALFIAIIAHPIGNLTGRWVTTEYHAQPIAYACVVMLGASLGLLLAAQHGPLGKETLRRPETWVYGLLQVLQQTFAVITVMYVSATDTAVLLSISTVMVFLLSLAFWGQQSSKIEWLGFVCMLVGLFWMLELTGVSGQTKFLLIVTLLLRGLVQAVQKMIAERHKTNNAAHTVKHNLRVTAVVMGVTAICLVVIFMGLGFLNTFYGVEQTYGLPRMADFFNWPVFLVATLAGFVVMSISKYCEFFAVKTIGARYLLAVTTLQPIFTMTYESSLSYLGIMTVRAFGWQDYLAISLVMLGSILIALAGLRTAHSTARTAGQEFILDPRINATVQQTINLTLTFTKGNQPRAAKLLGLDTTTFKNILADHQGQLQFTRDLVRNIQRHFAENVAMADPLTGLANRLQFTTALTAKLKGRGPVHVTLIDLNKFKPINDTHGHAAGDALLQMVAKRLKQLAPKNATVARLGGDEFALFSAAAINTKTLQAKLAVPYKTKFGSLTVTAALGVATYPKDGKSPEALLTAADKRMYSNKKG